MTNSSSFANLRRRLAPMIRPILEHFPPVRFFAVRLLRLKQSGKLQRCGLEFKLPSGDFGVTLEAESTGEYEPVTTELIQGLLNKGMTFVDIGAHVGLFTLPASQCVGSSGRVVAFEPHPDNFTMLLENIEQNSLPCKIEAIEFAVSDCSTPVHLHMSTFNTGDHQLFHKGSRNTIEVQCTSLDHFFEVGTNIDVIKMDVQGAEASAFRGMERVLEENQGIKIVWELSPAQLIDARSSASEVLHWLADRDFTCTIIDDAIGEVKKATIEEILELCPNDSYLNILCSRDD